MRTFFNKVSDITKALLKGYANNHQKCLTYGTLVFALLLNLIFGTFFSVLMTYLMALLYEYTYCFIPTKFVRFFNHWFEIPDFYEFERDKENYLTNPRHNFSMSNIWFIIAGLVIFIVVKIIFVFF